MPAIETLTGNVALRTGASKCHVFHAPLGGGEETFLGVAAQRGTGIKRLSAFLQPIPSVSGVSPEVGGRMTRATYEVPDGTMLKVFANKTAEGRFPISVCRFFRVRAGAALLRIRIAMVNSPDVVEPFATITGTIEHVPLEDAVALGARVKEEFKRMFLDARWEHLAEEEVIAAAKSEVAVVVRADGTALTMETPARRRRALRPD